MKTTLSLLLFCALAFGQQRPNIELQKEAMSKLGFLTGKWTGEGWVQRGPGEPMRYKQTEEVVFKLDGLVLLIEGTGRDPQSGEVTFNAMATVSYDEASKSYKMRSHSDGRYLETELKVSETGKGFEWGFAAGPGRVRYVMKIDDAGAWVETGEFLRDGAPPMKMLEMKVQKQK